MTTKYSKPLIAIAILATAVVIGSCSSRTTQFSCSSNQREYLKNPEFDHWGGCHYRFAGVDRIVYQSNKNSQEKPPILVFHELIGLTPQILHYADSLTTEFSVYIPKLFGSPDQDNILLGLVNGLLAYAFNNEWRPQQDRPIYTWAKHVSKWIANKHPNRNMGVIGMCLTGAMPLALLDNKQINGIVVSQPTLPIIALSMEAKSSLALSSKDSRIAIERTANNQVKILGLRFQGDTIAAREKLFTLKTLYKNAYIDREICADNYQKFSINSAAHSVLVYGWTDNPVDHPTNVRRNEVKKFFKWRLLAQEPPLSGKECNLLGKIL